MKKILVLCLVFALAISSGAAVFAEEHVKKDGEERIVTKEQREERLLNLFESYNPDGLEVYLDFKAGHKAFHENAEVIKQAFRDKNLAERLALRAQVANGEITKDEAKAIMEAKKETLLPIKEEVKSLLESKKEDALLIRESLKSIKDSLKVALSQDSIDSALVVELLDDLLLQLNAHLDMDIYYFDLIQDVIQ